MAILTVNGHEIHPDPASFEWGLQDVSVADAGRDQSGRMYKGRITQKRKIKLVWNLLKLHQVSDILNAFNPEYVTVTYPDALTGGMRTAEFYVGDRTAPMKWYNLADGTRFTTLSFDIIER